MVERRFSTVAIYLPEAQPNGSPVTTLRHLFYICYHSLPTEYNFSHRLLLVEIYGLRSRARSQSDQSPSSQPIDSR